MKQKLIFRPPMGPISGLVEIIASRDSLDDRTINFVVDSFGNNGNITLGSYIMEHRLGYMIPYTNNFKEIMRMIMRLSDVSPEQCRLIIIDGPHAIQKSEKLFGFFAYLEEIKNGILWDNRGKFKQKLIDSPSLWAFINFNPTVIVGSDFLYSDKFAWWYIEPTTKELKSLNITDIGAILSGII